MASRLSDRLLAAGQVSEETVRAAIARQAVYGGALDTALLEIEALDEATLWNALADATDLAVPDRALCEAPEKYVSPTGAAIELDAAWSVRCRAVPARFKDGTLQILCGEPVARVELDATAAALGVPFALYVAPEIWVAAGPSLCAGGRGATGAALAGQLRAGATARVARRDRAVASAAASDGGGATV